MDINSQYLQQDVHRVFHEYYSALQVLILKKRGYLHENDNDYYDSSSIGGYIEFDGVAYFLDGEW
ncbi:hypothetical protein ISU02_14200 [Fusibacter sp. Q10-2]|uniref:Uncharacterized protein n=1 Tax=Fusibacter ferrireducens TaxID=2785058 RepID=A0ABR9ZUX3_9FIRM|nr:hypothetical protein [Fusibacter ferrireducens]